MNKIIIASGSVIIENNKVLLDQHGNDNLWKFCGGRADGEDNDLISVAKRRAKEEMGIQINILDENPFVLYLKRNVDGKMKDIILVHFLAKRISEIKPGKEIKKWDWFYLNNLPENVGPNITPTLKYFGFLE